MIQQFAKFALLLVCALRVWGFGPFSFSINELLLSHTPIVRFFLCLSLSVVCIKCTAHQCVFSMLINIINTVNERKKIGGRVNERKRYH